MIHKVYVRHNDVPVTDRLSIPTLKRSVRATLQSEGVDMPCEVSILVTSDVFVKQLNSMYRDKDTATDVLSFPMIEFSPPGWAAPDPGEVDPDTGLVHLGEVVLSAQRVREQAAQYNQSVERETAYLTVHAMLHLLGYDHIDEGAQKREMRTREDKIVEKITL